MATASSSGSSTAPPPIRRSGPGGISSRSAPSGSGCRTTRGSTSRSSPTSRCGCCASPTAAGIQPAMVTDHGMSEHDAEVVVAGGAMLHDTGMSIHRVDHEAFSLFLAEPKLRQLLDGDLRGAGADGRRLGGAALHHRPPPPRRALHARGRGRPGRRRARHGPGPIAAAGRARRHRHPLDLGRGDRRRQDRARRPTGRSGSRSR